MLSLRSQWDLFERVELDLWIRYVDNLPTLNVDSYTTLDAKIAWKPTDNMEISLVGQNLIDNKHIEFKENSAFIPGGGNEVERSVYFQVTLHF